MTEPVYAFRRRGQDDFCTCTFKRYTELSDFPEKFEMRIFYTAPQPSPTAQAVAEPADTVVLNAAMRAIQQAIGLIGAPTLDLADWLDGCGGLTSKSAAAELRRLHALTTQQQRDLIAESHRTAEQKLRADQMTTQHAHQAALNTEARAQLAAALAAQAISKAPDHVAEVGNMVEQAISAEPAGAWIERWHGSGGKEGHEGWSIVGTNNRSLVAYLGREVDSDAVTAIVMAHNAAPAAPSTPVSGGWQKIETAPKDGTPLLLRSKKGRIADGAWITATSSCGGWTWAYVNLEPIEWQPLPVEPSMDGESNADQA